MVCPRKDFPWNEPSKRPLSTVHSHCKWALMDWATVWWQFGKFLSCVFGETQADFQHKSALILTAVSFVSLFHCVSQGRPGTV